MAAHHADSSYILKDIAMALAESGSMGLKMLGLELAEKLYREVAAQGMERRGTQSLVLALAKISGVDWPRREA
jgi:3-hydroxyisobutyrate dehydrogenase